MSSTAAVVVARVNLIRRVAADLAAVRGRLYCHDEFPPCSLLTPGEAADERDRAADLEAWLTALEVPEADWPDWADQ